MQKFWLSGFALFLVTACGGDESTPEESDSGAQAAHTPATATPTPTKPDYETNKKTMIAKAVKDADASAVDLSGTEAEALASLFKQVTTATKKQLPLKVDQYTTFVDIRHDDTYLLVYDYVMFDGMKMPEHLKQMDLSKVVKIDFKQAKKAKSCANLREAWAHFPQLVSRYTYKFSEINEMHSFDLTKAECGFK